MKRKTLIITILILVDQTIKILVYNFFMKTRFYIKGIVGFYPYLNVSQLSVFNNELNMGLSISVLCLINIFLFVAIIVFYFVSKRYSSDNCIKYLDKMFVYMLSGSVCSLIDKIFWGGSLDYFLVFSQIVDLKDIYLLVGFSYEIVWMFKSKT